jgi:hypothetical protein
VTSSKENRAAEEKKRRERAEKDSFFGFVFGLIKGSLREEKEQSAPERKRHECRSPPP